MKHGCNVPGSQGLSKCQLLILLVINFDQLTRPNALHIHIYNYLSIIKVLHNYQKWLFKRTQMCIYNMCVYIYIICIYDETHLEVIIHERYVASSYLQIGIINIRLNDPVQICRILLQFAKVYKSFSNQSQAAIFPLQAAPSKSGELSSKFFRRNWPCQLISASLISSCPFHANRISSSFR